MSFGFVGTSRTTAFLVLLNGLMISAVDHVLCPTEFQPYPIGASSCVTSPIFVTTATGCVTDVVVKTSIYPVPGSQQILVDKVPDGAALILQGLPPETDQYSSQDSSNYMVGYNATFHWIPQLRHAGRKVH
jgi:hypothetical protein